MYVAYFMSVVHCNALFVWQQSAAVFDYSSNSMKEGKLVVFVWHVLYVSVMFHTFLQQEVRSKHHHRKLKATCTRMLVR